MSKRRNKNINFHPNFFTQKKTFNLNLQQTSASNFKDSLLSKMNNNRQNKTQLNTINNSKIRVKTESEITKDPKLETIFNKNVHKYRDIVNPNDISLLPFLSSLRKESPISLKKSKILSNLKTTSIQQFLAGGKTTCNQIQKKKINDIQGRSKRLTTIYYRWHHKSGSNIRQNCLFQSKLRETSQKFFNKSTFKNLFNPIEYQKCPKRFYTQNQLICQKQKKLFLISQNSN